MIYCATSKCDGREVDHVFESSSDEDALEFAASQGWYFLEPEVDVELAPLIKPFKPRIVH